MKKSKTLSLRQIAMLDFIRDFITAHHYGPTIREVADGVGITSTSVCTYNLDSLVNKNLLLRDPVISRGLRLPDGAGGPNDYRAAMQQAADALARIGRRRGERSLSSRLIVRWKPFAGTVSRRKDVNERTRFHLHHKPACPARRV